MNYKNNDDQSLQNRCQLLYADAANFITHKKKCYRMTLENLAREF